MDDGYVSDCCGSPVTNIRQFSNGVMKCTCTECGFNRATPDPPPSVVAERVKEVNEIGFTDGEGKIHTPKDTTPPRKKPRYRPGIREYGRDDLGMDAVGWENLGKKMGYPQH